MLDNFLFHYIYLAALVLVGSIFQIPIIDTSYNQLKHYVALLRMKPW